MPLDAPSRLPLQRSSGLGPSADRREPASRAPRRSSSLWIAAGLALVAASCSGPELPPEPYRLEPVVDLALERLSSVGDADPQPADPDLVERIRGLAAFAGGGSKALRESSKAELVALGPGAIGPLGGLVADERAEAEERIAAASALARLGGPLAAELLLRQAEQARSPWIRALAAQELSHTDQDWVVPRLVYAFASETHPGVSVALAGTLSHFRNDSGWERLSQIARGTDEAAQQARDTIAEHLARREAASADELVQQWLAGAPALVRAEPVRSERYEREVWLTVARLGATDAERAKASYVLAHLSDTAARCLGQALHDQNPRVRINAARCLENIGPRGVAAGPQLVEALREPALAPAAALALGRVRFVDGADTLLELLDEETPYELRLAATRALGTLGEPRVAPTLEKLLASGATDPIACTAAESLLYLDSPAGALALLAEAVAREGQPSALHAARWWLERAAQGGDVEYRAILAEWDEPVGPPGLTPSTAERRAQSAKRAQLLRQLASRAGRSNP